MRIEVQSATSHTADTTAHTTAADTTDTTADTRLPAQRHHVQERRRLLQGTVLRGSF
jgi:hypothetical protein